MKRNLYIIIAVLVITSIAFRLINNVHLEQSTLLFIGLPALLSLMIIKYVETPKKIYGYVFFVLTLFLLMSGILLGEGIICILMAAPIFYAVGALLTFIYEYAKKKNKNRLSLITLPVLILLLDPFSYNKSPELQTVTTTQIVSKTSFDALKQSPDFMIDIPSYFKSGFPKPIAIYGEGVNIGDTRTISFESNTKGIGKLTLEIVDKTEDTMTFRPIFDNTHIHHWMTWKEVNIKLSQTEDNETQITWTSEYTCDLNPAWYFEPIEAFSIDLMHKHLIDAYFNN